MAASVHDTIFVCRPQQIREAAIVLSCSPPDRFMPLIVIEPPPITEEEYRKRYSVYVEVRKKRDAITGGALAQLEVIGRLDELKAIQAEVDQKVGTLTSYRSWWRHQRLVARILEKLPLRRAVFLFEPDIEEISLIDPVPFSRISDNRQPTIPTGLECFYLLSDGAVETTQHHRVYHSLSELAESAWRLCRPADHMPRERLDIPETDTNAYLVGLYRSLQSSVPLRPLRDITPTDLDTSKRDTAVGSTHEAVLIEVTEDATNLLAVQYAHHRRAKLVLYPAPDAQPIEAARASVERLQYSHTKGRFFGRLREYLFGNPAISKGIKGIEQAVSAIVPGEVITAVGELDLTVFTSGIPYNFVKKNGMDWSHKAIGHVSGDASLLILTEICRRSDTGIGFDLIFDPGFFRTSETKDVLAILKNRFSYPLVLRGEAGSNLALLHLGPSMPIDIIFFNTHGSDKTIILSDGPLPAYKLVQRVTLASQPIVFNSSCLSWVGVGREFVRIGARGYVGTLWSVDAELAGRYAKTILARMTRESMTVSRAMRRTGIDEATERAYIFVGTCNARLDEAPSEDADGERRRTAAAVRSLFEEVTRMFQIPEGRSTLPIVTSLEDLLWREAEVILREYDRRWPAPHLDRVDLTVLHLQALSYLVERCRGEAQKGFAMFDDAARALHILVDDSTSKHKRLSQLAHFAGRIHLRIGASKQAIDLLSRSKDEAQQAGESGAPECLELSDALKLSGRVREARLVAHLADTIYAAGTKTSGRLGSLGRLAQLSSALRDYEAALLYSRVGFKIATELDDPGERAEFKGDEARTLLKIKRYDEAFSVAKEFLDLTRQAHDDARELTAYGVIAEALIGQGQPEEASIYATIGLARAQEMGNQPEVKYFLEDLANIELLRGR